MPKTYLTSDWHSGEQPTPNTHFFLRPRTTVLMVAEWFEQCREVSRRKTLLSSSAMSGSRLVSWQYMGDCPPATKFLSLATKNTPARTSTRPRSWLKINDLVSLILSLKVQWWKSLVGITFSRTNQQIV